MRSMRRGVVKAICIGFHSLRDLAAEKVDWTRSLLLGITGKALRMTWTNARGIVGLVGPLGPDQ